VSDLKKLENNFDLLIIGSGVAGLTCALNLVRSNKNYKVGILSKSVLSEGSSLYAQGGIAVVLNQDDSLESHIQDTLIAGAGLCHRDAVEFTVKNARSAIEWLINLGVKFTKNNYQDLESNQEMTSYHLTQEGGHSHRRIIHADDSTGKSVLGILIDEIKKEKNIEIFEHHMAIDLILEKNKENNKKNNNPDRVLGAYVLDVLNSDQKVQIFSAKSVMLATGGASRAYLYSSNPEVSSGDGIAMAYRAGCRVANLEFNQFHPTCLYHPQAGSFLISEALRGEGAVLKLSKNTNSERFMPRFHELAELAPRDIVARAIDYEMKRLGLDCVYLDISHKSPEFIKSHFPSIYEKCLSLNIDITKEPIPVVPAAHYTCGGVMIDQHGRTDVLGLYAAGEVAFTGLHGANRMASNSLLECLVYAKAASEDLINYLPNIKAPEDLKPWDDSRVINSDEAIVVKQNWDEIRQLMWNYVGIVRSNKRLERAQRRINLLKDEVDNYYKNFKVDKNLLELRNLILLADLIIQSAQARHESRGLHFNSDYPALKNPPVDTVLRKK